MLTLLSMVSVSKFVAVLIFHCYLANSALDIVSGVDVDCGQSASYTFSTIPPPYETDAFRTWIYPKSIVTFSLCASPDDFNTKLSLYDYSTQTLQDECDAHINTGGCSDCGSGSFQETWTTTLDQGFYYIEVEGYTTGTYKLDVTCTPAPTMPQTDDPTTSPTTNNPTTSTAFPTTLEPTLSPTTSQPTTRSPTTKIPTTTPTNAPSRQPSDTYTPTESPIFGADGEAKNTVYNTLETGAESINDNNDHDARMDTVTMLLIIIMVLGVVILIGAVGFYLCFLKKKTRESVLAKQNEMIEITNVVPATTDGTNSSNNTIVGVVSVSISGDGDDGDTDNEMYVNVSQEDIISNMNGSPGSFEVSPGARGKTTIGNIGVDFMDIDINNDGEGAEEDILNESEIDQQEDNMYQMYDKQHNVNNKTVGIMIKDVNVDSTNDQNDDGLDALYQTPQHKITIS